ncbi:MAG: phospholipase [Dysgonamonadaceae bacterium]|jgi:hypothetical protein|nr:phospholipase [Dysgonamonadaceae bacterium]
MQSLFIFLGIIVFFVIALHSWNSIQRKKGNTEENKPEPPLIEGGCCGMHEVCERNSLLAAFNQKPEYFDDEELDQYKGKDSADYNEEQTEKFREIFYSLLDEEKHQWIHSLQLRGISIPDQMKDEVLMVIGDLRAKKAHG